MLKCFILDDDYNPIPCPDTVRAFEWRHDNFDRCSKKDTIGEVEISTVFLCLDHGYDSPVPILWETMIFGGVFDNYQARYATRYDALLGHDRVVECVKKGVDPNDCHNR